MVFSKLRYRQSHSGSTIYPDMAGSFRVAIHGECIKNRVENLPGLNLFLIISFLNPDAGVKVEFKRFRVRGLGSERLKFFICH